MCRSWSAARSISRARFNNGFANDVRCLSASERLERPADWAASLPPLLTRREKAHRLEDLALSVDIPIRVLSDSRKERRNIPPLGRKGIPRTTRLPPVSKAQGGLGAVGDSIRPVESGQIISGRVVDEAAIFGSHENALREFEIGTAAIDEGGAPLGAGAGKILRVENQTAGARQHERS